ncbi:flagella synthesis protein FlgN [Marinospirillum alkaliphilum]|uniref:Flagellar biosynthesis/type III secretory pathway chaperone n=1 Tax=Marinospirillum alkaliphilum DSM 21637 TaxID=1122209 RepID=A0A1K1ZGH2_9GAMM|nr:flagellar protein FlgN [Marinospirillum alkaliphilum]SFX73191.1 Flagellar biosynthesis/type III secretory pathway chaperone [Marinospirillum alkaliphilum DSM 21637]
MSRPAAQIFKDLLLKAIGNLQQLLKLLEQERELLQQPQSDSGAVEAITAAKNQLLERIQQDVDERCAFLVEQQLTPDMDGMDAFFDGLPPAAAVALRKGWNQLVELLELVKEENLKNGRLINRAVQHFDMLLNAMKVSQGKVRVYNPAGGAGDLNIPRNLGKA